MFVAPNWLEFDGLSYIDSCQFFYKVEVPPWITLQLTLGRTRLFWAHCWAADIFSGRVVNTILGFLRPVMPAGLITSPKNL